ncbi:MAG: hypothetical protein K8E24_011370 [Methanobacterium paludis]|nr:hypothetical protein [Methanobacterium paludis]
MSNERVIPWQPTAIAGPKQALLITPETAKMMLKKAKRPLLVVKDDGVGIPADIDVKKSDTLGLTLVRGLVEQIEGLLTFDMDHGTEITIIFMEREL